MRLPPIFKRRNADRGDGSADAPPPSRVRWHLAAAALLLVVLFRLLNTATEEAPGEEDAGAIALRQDYDYFLADMDSTSFNAGGQPRYRFEARRYTHFPEPDHALIGSPRVTIYRADQPPWTITAQSGRVENDPAREEEMVELRNDVVIHHVDERGRELNIYTEFLSVYPDSSYVSTDSPVRLETAGGEVASTGMTADLQSKHIRLLNNVQGHYE